MIQKHTIETVEMKVDNIVRRLEIANNSLEREAWYSMFCTVGIGAMVCGYVASAGDQIYRLCWSL